MNREVLDAMIDEFGVDHPAIHQFFAEHESQDRDIERRERAIAEADPDDALGVKGATGELLVTYDPTTRTLRDIGLTAAHIIAVAAGEGTEITAEQSYQLAVELHVEEGAKLRELQERAASIVERDRLVGAGLTPAEAMIRLSDTGWASPDAVVSSGEAMWRAQRAILMAERARDAVAHLPTPAAVGKYWR